MKTALNRVRGNYLVSQLLLGSAKPIQRALAELECQIRRKVWANGVTVDYDGITLKFPRDVGVGYSSSIYWNGTDGFEPKTWQVLRRFLESADCFLDIGSNIGLYAVLAKLMRKDLNVFAFEPIEKLYRQNLEFHRRNGAQNDVSQIAVSDSDGETDIFLPPSGSGVAIEATATLRSDSWQARKPGVSVHRVKTRTVDHIVEEHGIRGRVVFKIDVEDHESAVLRGATETLRNLRPAVVCEILPRAHGNAETFEVLTELGYLIWGISHDGLARFSGSDLAAARPFTDFLALPSEACPHDSFFAQPEALAASYQTAIPRWSEESRQ